MAKKGPGRAEREGISIVELFQQFPDNDGSRTLV